MALTDRLREIQSSQKTDVNWDQRKLEWLADVGRLFANVKQWLAEMRQQGLIQVDDSGTTDLREEHLGSYQAPRLEISVPGTESFKIVFEPVGRYILGARGRVDVYPRGLYGRKYMLILVERDDGQCVWELWKSKYARDKRAFDKQALEDIIEEWLNERVAG
ncbi:MAG TPA: hypothetical protein VND64_20055 [Pirellulales bacterium]|nr:hypothetical protein [Pirellulales bacterium]